MRRYSKFPAGFWSDQAVRAWSDDARLLAVYLHTCSHRSSEGYYRLPRAYAAADLGWTTDRLDEAMSVLINDDWIAHDAEAELILLTHALELHAPENPNQVKAAVRQLEELPASHLDDRFGTLAERFSQRLAQRLGERFPERFPKQPEPEPEPEPHPPPHPPRGSSSTADEDENEAKIKSVLRSEGHSERVIDETLKRLRLRDDVKQPLSWCVKVAADLKEKRGSVERSRLEELRAQSCGLCDENGWLLDEDRIPIMPVVECSHQQLAEAAS